MVLKSRLIVQLQQERRLRLPTLKNTYRKKDLTQIIADINKMLCTIDTATIEETNQLYSTAVVITEKLGCKVQSNRTSTQNTSPKKWKVRLQRKIDKWRVDVRCLEHLKNGTLQNKRIKATLTNKYHLKSETIQEVSGELKQRITATAKKTDSYSARIKQFRQNQQFSTNQQRFYQSLTETTDNLTDIWRNIWDYPKEHNHNAQWIQNAQIELGGNTMEDVQ